MAFDNSPLQFPDLVSFWDFQDNLRAQGAYSYELTERGGVVPVVEDQDAPFGGRARSFGKGAWLEIARKDCPALDIHGEDAQVSVVAWIKRAPTPPELAGGCQAVAGVWNEHGKRQYCLFLNLRIHDSREQVGAHISAVGGPTPGFRYCMDAAIGATPVPPSVWQCVAITYDGKFAKAYLNGELDSRGERNPYAYAGGIYDAGKAGGDFTVGAVARPQSVEMIDGKPVEHGSAQANLFLGLLGGLAVYKRALSDEEVRRLA